MVENAWSESQGILEPIGTVSARSQTQLHQRDNHLTKFCDNRKAMLTDKRNHYFLDYLMRTTTTQVENWDGAELTRLFDLKSRPGTSCGIASCASFNAFMHHLVILFILPP